MEMTAFFGRESVSVSLVFLQETNSRNSKVDTADTDTGEDNFAIILSCAGLPCVQPNKKKNKKRHDTCLGVFCVAKKWEKKKIFRYVWRTVGSGAEK